MCLQSVSQRWLYLSSFFLSLQHAVIVASLGATAFIVFAMPASITALRKKRHRRAHSRFILRILFSLIPHTVLVSSVLVYSLAVGVAIFTMVITDTNIRRRQAPLLAW